MKKIYIVPKSAVVVVETNKMVCTSLEVAGDTQGNVTGADSRMDSWLDDDEENDF